MTRDTFTSRPRSPERRSPPVMVPTDRPRYGESSKATAGDSKLRPSKTEQPQGMIDQHKAFITSLLKLHS
jgi:hypothetical protein